MKSDIIIPLELGANSLSVEEIGCIFLIMAFPHLSDEVRLGWLTDGTFLKTFEDLIREEIIVIGDDGTLDINLTWLQ